MIQNSIPSGINSIGEVDAPRRERRTVDLQPHTKQGSLHVEFIVCEVKKHSMFILVFIQKTVGIQFLSLVF